MTIFPAPEEHRDVAVNVDSEIQHAAVAVDLERRDVAVTGASPDPSHHAAADSTEASNPAVDAAGQFDVPGAL